MCQNKCQRQFAHYKYIHYTSPELFLKLSRNISFLRVVHFEQLYSDVVDHTHDEEKGCQDLQPWFICRIHLVLLFGLITRYGPSQGHCNFGYKSFLRWSWKNHTASPSSEVTDLVFWSNLTFIQSPVNWTFLRHSFKLLSYFGRKGSYSSFFGLLYITSIESFIPLIEHFLIKK